MDKRPRIVVEPDPVIEYYKARLDREAIRIMARTKVIEQLSRETGRPVEELFREQGEGRP